MTNAGTETLNQVLNRWAANFRAAQETRVLNEATIMNLGIFELQREERLALRELNVMLIEASTAQEFA